MLGEELKFPCASLNSSNNECNDMCIQDTYICCQYCSKLDDCKNEGISFCDMVQDVVNDNA